MRSLNSPHLRGIDRRRSLLLAALAFNTLQWHAPVPPVAVALTQWLDSRRQVDVAAHRTSLSRVAYSVRVSRTAPWGIYVGV